MKDFDPNFMTHPQTGDLSSLSGKRAVFQAFKTLVLASIDDFIMREDIMGGGVYNSLFEDNNALLHLQLRNRIEEIARLDEPRIVIKDMVVERKEKYRLMIRIKYLYQNETELIEDTILIRRSA